MSARAIAMLVLAVVALGCDQVGAPLVDSHRPQGGGILPIHCPPPPICLPPEPVERVLAAMSKVEVTRCGGTELLSCVMAMPIDGPGGIADEPADGDEPPPPPDEPPGDSDMDGGVEGGDVSMEPDDALPCDGAVPRSLPRELGCGDLISGDAYLPVEPLRGVKWSQANVRLLGSKPSKVVLHEPELHDLFIELRGPITLRIERGARVEGVRIAGLRTGAGAPRVEVDFSTMPGLVIGDGDRPFEGAVSLRSATLEAVQVIADELTLESTKITGGLLQVRSLNAGDVFMEDVSMEVEHGIVASGELVALRVDRCGELAFAGLRIAESAIGPCSAPVRLYDCNVNQTALDGPFELESGGMSQARLGTRAPTKLAMWFGVSESSSLCGQFEQLALSGQPVFKCGLCDPVEMPIETFCDLPNAEPYFDRNACLALELGEQRPRCEQPWPERHRPFDSR